MVSETQVEIDTYHDKAFIRQLKECVFKKQDDVYTVNEVFRKSYMFLRHSKTVKYFAGFDVWQTIFQRFNIKLPKEIDPSLFDRLIVAIVDVMEYTDCDENGRFKIIENRKEVIVTTKFVLKDMKINEFDSLTCMMWHISQLFVKFIKWFEFTDWVDNFLQKKILRFRLFFFRFCGFYLIHLFVFIIYLPYCQPFKISFFEIPHLGQHFLVWLISGRSGNIQ